jgi:hypothetical protein
MIGSLIAHTLITGVDWKAKVVSETELKSILRFKTLLPKADVPYKIKTRRVVWIPKIGEFPDFSARQAVRFTLVTAKGDHVELIQAPAQTSASAQRHLGIIWSQGYTGLEGKNWRMVPYRIGKTDIAVIARFKIPDSRARYLSDEIMTAFSRMPND